jgi:hypothetical protein
MADLDVRAPAPVFTLAGPTPAHDAARAELRRQIRRLDLRLSQTLTELLWYGPPWPSADAAGARVPGRSRGPCVLGLGQLEQVRDDLAARVATAAADLRRRANHAARARLRLEEMRQHPERHRFARITLAELGEGPCGVWEVRPRLGLLGMLAGWWELKLSSGCP